MRPRATLILAAFSACLATALTITWGYTVDLLTPMVESHHKQLGYLMVFSLCTIWFLAIIDYIRRNFRGWAEVPVALWTRLADRVTEPVPVREKRRGGESPPSARPPVWADYFAFFLPKDKKEECRGDLQEWYGEAAAKFHPFWLRVLLLHHVLSWFGLGIGVLFRKLAALGLLGWLLDTVAKIARR